MCYLHETKINRILVSFKEFLNDFLKKKSHVKYQYTNYICKTKTLCKDFEEQIKKQKQMQNPQM